MKRFSLIAVAAAALFIANVTMAQPPQAGMKQHAIGGQMGKLPFEDLGLTDEQKAQIHQIMLDARKKNIDVEAKLKLANIELHELMGAEAPDQGKINAKISEVSQLREKIMRNHIESKLAVQKVLTPEQRKKAKTLRPMKHEHMRHHFEGPGMMRRGGFGFGDDWEMPELENEL
jgi:Spy/CpxP family protein refolding chaperone